MSAGTKIIRLVIGTVLAVAILVATFALLHRWTYTWGATEAEVQRVLPGDELIPRTPADATHAGQFARDSRARTRREGMKRFHPEPGFRVHFVVID